MNNFDAVIAALCRIKNYRGLFELLFDITSAAGDILAGATAIDEDMLARDVLLNLVVLKVFFRVIGERKPGDATDASAIARSIAENLQFYQKVHSAMEDHTMPLTQVEDKEIVYN